MNQMISDTSKDWPEPGEFDLNDPAVPSEVMHLAIDEERNDALRKTFFYEYVGNKATFVGVLLITAVSGLAWAFEASDEAGPSALAGLVCSVISGIFFVQERERFRRSCDIGDKLREMGWAYYEHSRKLKWDPKHAKPGSAKPPRMTPPPAD